LQAIAPSVVLNQDLVRAHLGAIEGPIRVVAAGKAAWPMAVAFDRLRPAIDGMVAGPRVGTAALPSGFEWFNARHPSPNAESAAAGRRALELAASPRATLVVLLSGGASALMVNPAPGVTLDEKLATAQSLMRAGVAIDGLNCVRKHLSGVKGGRLGAAAVRSLTLAISDVHGPVTDDPSVIGSGPTVADPTTYADALEVIRQASTHAPGLAIPEPVLQHLEQGKRGAIAETVKPGDPRLGAASYAIVANRLTAMHAARDVAAELGYVVHCLPSAVVGEAREAAASFVDAATRIAEKESGPVCVLGSGETTVLVTGRGIGGRNQEFALAAAPLLADAGRESILASAGTDGIDGPTAAAGAIVDRTTVARSQQAGLDWRTSLADNDAYHFFLPLGDLLMWGPTGTNVGDLQVFLSA